MYHQKMVELLRALIELDADPEKERFAATTMKWNDESDTPLGDIEHAFSEALEISVNWITERETSRGEVTDEEEITRVKIEFDSPMDVQCGAEDSPFDVSCVGVANFTLKEEEEEVALPALKTVKREHHPGDALLDVSDYENDDTESEKTCGAWSDDAESEAEEEKKDKCTTCGTCGKSFTTTGTLRVHKLKHLSDDNARRPYQCDQCPKRFTQAGSLSVHKRTHLDKDDPNLTKFKSSWTCNICGKILYWRASMYTHMRSHLGTENPKELAVRRPHRCAQCNKCFAYKIALKKHELLHTGERPFKCELCPRAFYDKKGLKVHLTKHGKGTARPVASDGSCRNFHCTICPRKFRRSWQLDAHMIRHAEDAVGSSSDEEENERVGQLFTCELCSNTYPRKSSLKRHEVGVHGIRPYHCVTCDLHYAKLKDLTAHLKKEHDEKTPLKIMKSFQCEHCPGQFTTEFAMEKHRKVHDGPSSFKCSRCEETFTSFALLEDHKRTHDPLPYECKHCRRKYESLMKLAEHKTKCEKRMSKKNSDDTSPTIAEPFKHK